MPDGNLFLLYADRLNRLGVPYMITGSVAATLYGEPRFTHDVDLVIELSDEGARRLASAFPMSEFYCPPLEILISEAHRTHRGHFNLIHHESGLKAYVYLKGREDLHEWGMSHRRTLSADGCVVQVAPPEYVILRKIEFFREGGSEKHLLDCRAILELCEGIDHPWLQDTAASRGLSDLLSRVRHERPTE